MIILSLSLSLFFFFFFHFQILPIQNPKKITSFLNFELLVSLLSQTNFKG
jgi:hypothetical protein